MIRYKTVKYNIKSVHVTLVESFMVLKNQGVRRTLILRKIFGNLNSGCTLITLPEEEEPNITLVRAQGPRLDIQETDNGIAVIQVRGCLIKIALDDNEYDIRVINYRPEAHNHFNFTLFEQGGRQIVKRTDNITKLPELIYYDPDGEINYIEVLD